MRREGKTKEQRIDELVDELMELHRRIARLKASEPEREQLEERRGLRIGEVLIRMGYLTLAQLEEYLKKQKTDILSYMLDYEQRKLGEILVDAGVITEDNLQKALLKQKQADTTT